MAGWGRVKTEVMTNSADLTSPNYHHASLLSSISLEGGKSYMVSQLNASFLTSDRAA